VDASSLERIRGKMKRHQGSEEAGGKKKRKKNGFVRFLYV
jgi:hypothetical protein